MTEKIIIDGIDVSGCEQLDEWKHCNCCNDLIKTIYPKATKCHTEQDLRCETYTNCGYKQLQRTKAQYDAVVEQNKSLQAECEELKRQYNNLCKYQLEEKSRIEQDHVNFIDEIIRYKQALEEIEQLVINPHCEACKEQEINCNCEECNFADILCIINKARGENK